MEHPEYCVEKLTTTSDRILFHRFHICIFNDLLVFVTLNTVSVQYKCFGWKINLYTSMRLPAGQ